MSAERPARGRGARAAAGGAPRYANNCVRADLAEVRLRSSDMCS